MNKYAVPGYIKYFFIVSNIIVTSFLIMIGNPIVTPLLAATIIAILLKPFSAKLERLGIPRVLSALFLVILFFLLILIFITYFTAQLANISTDTSLTSASFENAINSFQNWVLEWFNISLQDQIKLFSNYFKNFMSTVVTHFPTALAGTISYLSTMVLFLFSLFFFLYYRSFFLSFIYKVFDKQDSKAVKNTLTKIDTAVKNYIVGMFFVIITIATLNSLGLLLLGIRHAIFFGIFVAMLTIIPYIGIIIGSIIPIVFAAVTTDSLWYPIGVILVFSFVQFLEGNFITPIIIGYKVDINPYFAILGLFVGGMLLGMIGVILAIPLLGIVKIICDQIDSLQPIGYILGRPKKGPNLIEKILGLIAQKKIK